MNAKLHEVQGHLDSLDAGGIKAALAVVISWPIKDQQLGTVRRQQRAKELLQQIENSEKRLPAARRFLHSCATTDLGYQFLGVEDG